MTLVSNPEVTMYGDRWRDVAPRHRPDWAKTHPSYVEFLFDNGLWVWPDCSYECRYCGECIGCLRKCFGPESSNDPRCESSPDGEHHVDKP